MATSGTFDQNAGFTQADVQNMIDKALAAQQAQHQSEMETLRTQLSGATPASAIPEHAAGPGTKVAPTWGLADQTAQLLRRERALADAASRE